MKIPTLKDLRDAENMSRETVNFFVGIKGDIPPSMLYKDIDGQYWTSEKFNGPSKLGEKKNDKKASASNEQVPGNAPGSP